MLRLPEHLHAHTVIGFDLTADAIYPIQLSHDLLGLAEDRRDRLRPHTDTFAACAEGCADGRQASRGNCTGRSSALTPSSGLFAD
eukprot:3327882-Amphidinium_carterae.1